MHKAKHLFINFSRNVILKYDIFNKYIIKMDMSSYTDKIQVLALNHQCTCSLKYEIFKIVYLYLKHT